MNRSPVVAGQFYPADAQTVRDALGELLPTDAKSQQAFTRLAMVPHAGWQFSGQVCGATLARASLASTIVLLGPNHTGRGKPVAVWDSGVWNLPGGEVRVHELMAAELCASPQFQTDAEAHLGEHSLEVVLPFLRQLVPDVRVVPVAVAESGLEALMQAAEHLAGVIKGFDDPVSIVVSSDMSHYIPADAARERDSAALDRVVALDPQGLYETVRSRGISMCGVLPMTMGLATAKALGATRGEIVDYATSGDVTGDDSSVVGYAGVLVS